LCREIELKQNYCWIFSIQQHFIPDPAWVTSCNNSAYCSTTSFH